MSRDELLDPSLRERVAAEYERFCEAFDNAARDRSAMNCRELALRADGLMRAVARARLEAEELLSPHG
jgi:hypothetical protein